VTQHGAVARRGDPGHERPAGLVVAAYRRHYTVEVAPSERIDCVLKGRSMQVACGDRVRIARASDRGVVESIEPRTTLFYRSDAFREKLIAANVTQVVGVVAPDLALDEELLNRWIVAAEAEGCAFVLVANKSDLPSFGDLTQRLAPYRSLGLAPLALSAKRDVAPLLALLEGQRSVLIGQSGMGKSTIINAVAPEARARTAEVSQALRSGRHTTTSTALFHVPSGNGWIVDSPGMRVFGLAHYPPEAIERAFVELRELVENCRFSDCRHDREPGCAVRAAVTAGHVSPQRVELLRTLVSESKAARDPRNRR
jgi:ribosome biogenesis GTPase / thiamine phosphate phosphatase